MEEEKIIEREQLIAEFRGKVEEYTKLSEEIEQKRQKLLDERKALSDKLTVEFMTVDAEDNPKWQELRGVVQRVFHDSNRGKLVKLFTDIFKNMSSKTLTVAQKKDYIYDADGRTVQERKSEITVGTFGFGVKRNEASRRADDFSSISDILQRRTEIIASLNEHRYLWRWADKLERFAAIVGDEQLKLFSSSKEDVKIELRTPIFNFMHGDVAIVNRLVLRDDSYQYGYNTHPFCFLLNNKTERSESLTRFVSMDRKDQAVVYLQLRDEMLERYEEIMDTLRGKIQAEEQLFVKLRDTFSKELLLVDI